MTADHLAERTDATTADCLAIEMVATKVACSAVPSGAGLVAPSDTYLVDQSAAEMVEPSGVVSVGQMAVA